MKEVGRYISNATYKLAASHKRTWQILKTPHRWGGENMGRDFYMFTLCFLSNFTSPVCSAT